MTSKPQRRRNNSGTPRQTPAQPPKSETPQEKPSKTPSITGKKAWFLRIVLALGAPAVFLVVLEVILLIIGFGTPSSFFAKAHKPGLLTPNQMFIWFFRQERSTGPHPCMVPIPKPAGTLRLFILGGSAAMGTPQPAYGFARILELMLQDTFPEHRIEVINTAMRGINSHILRPIAAECAKLDPDLVVVYAGNNEFTGRYGANTFWGRHPAFIPWLHAMKRPRTSQLIRRSIQGVFEMGTPEDAIQTMDFFRQERMTSDFPQRQVIYRNYRENIKHICECFTAENVPVLLLTLPVNLRNWAPMGALHRRGLSNEEKGQWDALFQTGIKQEKAGEFLKAIASYQQAAQLDDHYADLHFRWAHCYLALNQFEQAYKHFSLARDWDALQFRTDGKLNETIRELASQIPNNLIHLIDVAHQWADPNLGMHGIPGNELFNDHVHFSFRGDYALAKTIYATAVNILEVKRCLKQPESISLATQAQCARRLAYTALDHLTIIRSMAQMTAVPPFTDQLDHAERQVQFRQEIDRLRTALDQQTLGQSLDTYRQAINERPKDWNLRFGYANHLYQCKRYRDTAYQMEHVVKQYPDIAPFRILLGYALAGTGQVGSAQEHFRYALQLGTHNNDAHQAVTYGEQLKQTLR